MTEVLYGKDVAYAMKEGLVRKTAGLSARGVTPTLAIVRVGKRADDIAYERAAQRRCAEVGVDVRMFVLDAEAEQDTILDIIEQINSDETVHGCLLFRPLPGHIDESRVCNALAPEKDVDGITESSLAGVFSGSGKGYSPCTAQACMELLEYYGVDLSGKRTVVVGRSLVIGKPVAMMALARHATVTLCHSKTVGLAEECRAAEVLIVAAGSAGLVDKDHLNPNGIVVDVGINLDESGNLCGDVLRGDAETARAYTPVPGGVGSVTTVVLIKHVVAAAEKRLV